MEHPMTKEWAEKVREAFGGCSIVYECWTIQEIIDDCTEGLGRWPEDSDTVESWCAGQIMVEDVHADRACIDDGEPYKRWKAQEKRIRERLKAIGIVPTER